MAPVTSLYAAAVALWFVVLSARVVLYRRGNGISLGDGGDVTMLRRSRAQGNCAEYAPIGLVLLLLAELGGAGAGWLHLTGLLLLAGRLAHGVALSFLPPPSPLRVAGMALTFTAILLGAVLTLAAGV